MNLLHVTSTMDPAAGGVSQGIRLLISEFDKLGIRSEVVSLDPPLATDAANIGFEIHRLGPGKYGWWYSPAVLPWLEQNIPRFDGVIIHGIWVYPSFAVWRAWNRLRKKGGAARVPPYFVYPHGMLDPYFQRAPDRRLKAVRNYFYWKLVEHRIIRDAEMLLFTCEEERLLARQPFRPYQPRKEMVTGLGTEPPPAFEKPMKAAFASQCPGLGDEPYLLFLSRIHPKKGVDILIKGYAALGRPAPPKLVVAGPGIDTQYGREMQKLAARLCPAGAVFWPGMLGGNFKWGALYGCEALVLPSHQENFGIVVAEALACGKPVLISDKVNIWREIQAAGAGIVGPDTEAGVRQVLESWLADSSGIRQSGPAAAARCFKSNFSIDASARRFIEAIRP